MHFPFLKVGQSLRGLAGRQSPQVDGTDIIMMEVRCVMTIVRQYLLQASLASDCFDTGIFMHADA